MCHKVFKLVRNKCCRSFSWPLHVHCRIVSVIAQLLFSYSIHLFTTCHNNPNPGHFIQFIVCFDLPQQSTPNLPQDLVGFRRQVEIKPSKSTVVTSDDDVVSWWTDSAWLLTTSTMTVFTQFIYTHTRFKLY